MRDDKVGVSPDIWWSTQAERILKRTFRKKQHSLHQNTFNPQKKKKSINYNVAGKN